MSVLLSAFLFVENVQILSYVNAEGNEMKMKRRKKKCKVKCAITIMKWTNKRFDIKLHFLHY